MNVNQAVLLTCLLLPLAAAVAGDATSQPAVVPGARTSLDDGWRFHRGDPDDAKGSLDYAKIRPWIVANGNEFTRTEATRFPRPAGNPGEGLSYLRSDFLDRDWQPVDLPHDWAIEQPFDIHLRGEIGKLPISGVGWYRRHLTAPAGAVGERFYLDVEGAMSYAAVWLNGQFVGGWPYGYSSFELDLTPYLHVGADNVLAIRLDNPPASSRWYPGAGLNRNVWLVRTQAVHVAHWGVTVTTPDVTADAATVALKTTISNSSPDPAAVEVVTAIYPFGVDQSHPPLCELSQTMDMAAGESKSMNGQITVSHPQLWDISTPQRYVAVTTVKVHGHTVDTCQTPFGIRTIHFDPDHGFLLNGRRVPLQGVCDHADLGALGTVVNVAGLRRQLLILQGLGCNSIRTSHNPPAPELLDLCDQMGMLVMDESFDCWAAGKNQNDYHVLWADWHEKDWRAELRRDRNHPSIILWSTGNEVPDLTTAGGPRIAAELTTIAHEEDPTRPTTFACDQPLAKVTPGFVGTGDIWGENYRTAQYTLYRKDHPGLIIFGSETASTLSSRGEYFFPATGDPHQSEVNYQVSSYDLTCPPWGNTPDEQFRYLEQLPYLLGEFVWTGFDYLGEPTPYNSDFTNLLNFSDPVQRAKAAEDLKSLGKQLLPSRSSYFGIVDLCGFPKDRYYLYQSRWRPDLPMAHILPHWNWPERVGMVTPVHVYTSGDEAELFLNGRSMGRQKMAAFHYRLQWDDVRYQPGELKVVVYKHGKEWARDVVKTTGAAAQLLLKADRTTIDADGRDLSFITVNVADAAGATVPRSHPRIQFSLAGPGQIVAVDNGDPTDLESFHPAVATAASRKAFNGMCLVIVRAQRCNPGQIVVSASAADLHGSSETIQSASAK